jgi:NitT/TauT family transport system substrate-binding protein
MRATFRAAAIVAVICVLAITSSAAPAWSADSPTKLTLGYTLSTDSVGIFVADDLGFFKKHNLDVKLQVIALNPLLISAVQSGSVQIVAPSASVVLQAYANGVDLVAIGGGPTTKKDGTNYAVVSGATSNVSQPSDLIGKKVGVPGLGATLHLLGREWLRELGIDYHKVTFIEVPLAQMNDVLKAGTVDAVISTDPMTSRLIETGNGKLLSYLLKDLKVEVPTTAYSVMRPWAQQHPDVISEFQQALQEGADYIEANPEKTRAIIGNHIKIAPSILQTTFIPWIVVPLSTDGLLWWANVMKDQGALKEVPNIERMMKP